MYLVGYGRYKILVLPTEKYDLKNDWKLWFTYCDIFNIDDVIIIIM